ncbi:hypothetical protein [uncultured Eubacterium sp.]|uniref:hypothetical protein n=1 Tax=uncultured Eubacterium sp. TaxID=165185 RepID=UPI00260E2D10|nr:hypothetical protein [uncultured Eubacterium sp.]
MYKNWSKKTAKRFLAGTLITFVALFGLTLILVVAISGRDDINIAMSFGEKVLLSIVCALVPVSSLTGFCVEFIRIDELTTKQIVLMVAFCIPMVVLSVPFGFAMLVPTVVKCLKLQQNT